MIRKRSKSVPLICAIDINGFAVVMVIFVSFILVIMTSRLPPLYPERYLSVYMPGAHHPVEMPGADLDEAMVIVIARDGKVFFGCDWVEPEQLPALIRARLTWYCGVRVS